MGRAPLRAGPTRPFLEASSPNRRTSPSCFPDEPGRPPQSQAFRCPFSYPFVPVKKS